jgi:hypothetical protein
MVVEGPREARRGPGRARGGSRVAPTTPQPDRHAAARPPCAAPLPTRWSGSRSRRRPLAPGVAPPAPASPEGSGPARTAVPRPLPQSADHLHTAHQVTACTGGIRLPEVGQGLRVMEDRRRLLDRLQVLGTGEHDRGAPVPGGHHALVLVLDPVDDLGQGATCVAMTSESLRAEREGLRVRRQPPKPSGCGDPLVASVAQPRAPGQRTASSEGTADPPCGASAVMIRTISSRSAADGRPHPGS